MITVIVAVSAFIAGYYICQYRYLKKVTEVFSVPRQHGDYALTFPEEEMAGLCPGLFQGWKHHGH
jgi:hypothetical protein